MTENQIKHMAERFLGWRLPENFNPDNGISFKPTFNDHLPEPTKCNPTGTNLFDYTQSVQMVRYMIEGSPTPTPPAGELVEDIARALARSDGVNFDEVCGVDADPDEGYCDSGTCVAAYYSDDHDADWARSVYLRKAEDLIPFITAAEKRGRVAGLDEAANIAEKWRDENRVGEAKARKREALHGVGGYEAPMMSDMLQGAAIECNAIMEAIRNLMETPDD